MATPGAHQSVAGQAFWHQIGQTCNPVRSNGPEDTFIAHMMLKYVYNDVSIEPMLIPLTGERFKYQTANKAQDARLDVCARGFWVRGQRAFCDVRVFDSTAPRLLSKSLQDIHKQHEQEKRISNFTVYCSRNQNKIIYIGLHTFAICVYLQRSYTKR